MTSSALFPCVVVFGHDVERLAAFYAGVAGLQRVHADADHVVLSGHGLELVLHRLRGAPAPSGAPAPAPREDSYLKLALPVDDLDAARARAAAAGGALQPASREWEARGFRAVDGVDPEGNVMQVRVSRPSA